MSVGTIAKIKCNDFERLTQGIQNAQEMGKLPENIKMSKSKPYRNGYSQASFESYHSNHKHNYGGSRGVVDHSIDFSKRKFVAYVDIPELVNDKNGFYLKCGYLYWNEVEKTYELLFDVRGEYEGGTGKGVELAQQIAKAISDAVGVGVADLSAQEVLAKLGATITKVEEGETGMVSAQNATGMAKTYYYEITADKVPGAKAVYKPQD